MVVAVLGQEEHPAQRAQVHFFTHGWELGAHQLSHAVVVLIVVAVVVAVAVGVVVAPVPGWEEGMLVTTTLCNH